MGSTNGKRGKTMSKAEKLLKISFEYLDLLTANIDEDNELIKKNMEDIRKYLSRKNRISIDSEWVCDESFLLPLLGRNTVIFEETLYRVFWFNEVCVCIDRYDENIMTIPEKMFFTYFSPKEDE